MSIDHPPARPISTETADSHPEAGAPDRVIQIEHLHRRILTCRGCHDEGYLDSVRPIRHAWSPTQRTMIVGQAPGAQTESKRYHFAGPGGRLLESWLVAAGFPQASWRDRTYITSLTRCFPGKSPRGKGDRKPSPAELALCRPFLETELALVQPRLILPIGMMAIEHFLGRQSLELVVGAAVERNGYLLLPFPHPSPVSRWLNDPAHRLLVDKAIDRLRRYRVELDL